ncbi:tetratricopeptide repeat protein, partial [Breznakiellaceae bacterium SP9]
MKVKIYQLVLLIFAGLANVEAQNVLSLQEAIEQSAMKIASDLPGSRVSVVAFESEHDNLSNYIMEELTGALVNRRIEVADRNNLPYVYKQLNLQPSGDVSDKAAQSIGKFLGAQLIITGQLLNIGETYRYRINAVHVERATRDSSVRLDVRNDQQTQSMVAVLARQQTNTLSRYGVTEQTVPKTPGIFLDRGILFASRGEYGPAIADFTEALKLDPNLSAAYQLRGRALFASVSKVTSTGENFSGVDTAITEGAWVSEEQSAVYEQAIRDFTQALKLDQNNAGIYYERGNAYNHKRDYERAIADCTQAIRLDSNYAAAYNGRGVAYVNKGDYDRAIADYTQAIRLDSNLAIPYNNRGLAYKDKGDYDRAIADCTQAIRLDSNYAAAYSNRGNAYYGKGDYDRAIADHTQAIRLDPNLASA